MSKNIIQEFNDQRRQSQTNAIRAIGELAKVGIDISKLDISDANNLVSAISGEACHNTIGVVSALRSVFRLKQDSSPHRPRHS